MNILSRILIIFLDGVGIGSSDADVNPLVRARLDNIAALLGSQAPLSNPTVHQAERATLVPLDATLGMPGMPQSGTGQTALFTGFNAAREFGRHFGPWVPTTLRERLSRENVLVRAKSGGLRVAFANAYPEELFENTGDRRTRDREKTPVADPLRAGPPIVALGAGVLTRHTAALAHGDAVASEITNDGWRKHLLRTELPVISAAEAGRNLARIAAHHEVTLFAHYSTDYIGHRGHMWEAVEAMQKVDEFLGGVLAAMPQDLTVAVVSDHGNIEDIDSGHTINPALGLFFGAAHAQLADGLTDLTSVTPAVLAGFGLSTP